MLETMHGRIKSLCAGFRAYGFNAVAALLLGIVLSLSVYLFFHVAASDLLDRLPCLYLYEGFRREAGYFYAVLSFVIGIPVLFFWFSFAGRILKKLTILNIPSILRFHYSKKDIFKVSGILLVAWLPYFIIYFPGTTTALDTINQIYQAVTPAPTYYAGGVYINAEYIDDNPAFVSMLFGAFIMFGRALGSDVAGFTIFIIVQVMLFASLLAFIICYEDRLKVPPVLQLLSLLFCALFPVIPGYTMTMVKDMVFTFFFLLFSLLYIEVFRTEGEALKSKKYICAFVLVAICCIFARKTGLYIVIASLLILGIVFRRFVFSVLITFFVPLITSVILVPTFIYPLLGISSPPASKAAIHMTYQASIALLQARPNAYSEDELAVLSKVIDINAAIKEYDPSKTDGVVHQIYSDAEGDEIVDYLFLCLKKVFEYPYLYCIKPMVLCTGPLVIPSEVINIEPNVSQWGIEQCRLRAEGAGHVFYLDVQNPELTQKMLDKLYGTVYMHACAALPGISLLFTKGLYGGWIPIIVLITIFFFDKKNIWALSPVLLHSAMLLVNPVAFGRYMIPCVFLAVLLMAWMAYCVKKNNVQKIKIEIY